MAHEDDRAPLLAQAAHPLQAAALELHVPDGEDLVHEHQLGLQVGGDRECQSQLHPRRVALQRGLEEALDAGERDDLVVVPAHLATGHAHDGAAQVDVLATGQLGVKPGAHLEQDPHPAAGARHPDARLGDPAEDLEQRGLAGPVGADDAEGLALAHVEVDVAQGPELLPGPLARRPDRNADEMLSRRLPYAACCWPSRYFFPRPRTSITFSATARPDPRTGARPAGRTRGR